MGNNDFKLWTAWIPNGVKLQISRNQKRNRLLKKKT